MTVTIIDKSGAQPLWQAKIRTSATGGVPPLDPAKFRDPDITAKGERRAEIGLDRLVTLWFNTGTLCNIECANCYIESGPRNDRLSYLTLDDVTAVLDEISSLGLDTREIAFTGGEPFMNPHFLAILQETLARGFEALVLTNAMQPMQRKRIKEGLLRLRGAHGDRLAVRVSLDHYCETLHEAERGPGSWASTIAGLDWLAAEGFRLSIAGRTCWGENDATARAGYADLCADRGYPVDTRSPAELVLFPEMDATHDVPEITAGCFDVLGVAPSSLMCATSRMVVKRKGDAHATVLPCTLLAYDRQFDMGPTLAASLRADGGSFRNGAVKLNHPHCAKFCVLGGGSCTVDE